MGFIVKQPIQTINQGNLEQFYVRLESYTIHKAVGILWATAACYPDSGSANTSLLKYIGDTPDSIQSSIISTQITYNGNVFDYPSFIEFPLTSSVNIEVTVYETNILSSSVNYYDFDENGDVVEKTRIEYTSQSIQTGIETVTKYFIDANVITGSVYPYAYNLMKTEYGKIFGEENIIDQI